MIEMAGSTSHSHVQKPREQLKKAMNDYDLSEFDMARQLGISLFMVKSYLTGGSVPYYVESLVEEWLE